MCFFRKEKKKTPAEEKCVGGEWVFVFLCIEEMFLLHHKTYMQWQSKELPDEEPGLGFQSELYFTTKSR